MKRVITTLAVAFLAVVGVYAVPSRSMVGARSVAVNADSGKEAKPYLGLCFTAEEPNVVVNMSKKGSPPAVTFETSTDGIKWIPFDADGGTTPITLVSIGDYVYFRAGASGNLQMGFNDANNRSFTLSGKCGASGDLTSLLSHDFPVETLTKQYGLAYLFMGCSFLTKPPELPSKQVSASCYYQLFKDCKSLEYAPKLEATVLAGWCYYSMFSGCSALRGDIDLPATSNVNCGSCYRSMFSNCNHLDSVHIHFTSFGANGEVLRDMFHNCMGLKSIRVDFSSWGSSSQMNGWVGGILSSTGIFYCPTALGTNDTIERGASRCPNGWTVVNID